MAFDLSLMVTRVLPCAAAHANAASMIRATPLRVLISSDTWTSSGVPTLSERPLPRYCPSVFSRKMTKSMAVLPPSVRRSVRSGDRRGWKRRVGRKLM